MSVTEHQIHKGEYRIYKYALRITDEQALMLPRGAVPLATDMQRDVLCLWVMVDTEQPAVMRRVFVAGTGNPLPDEIVATRYVGSTQDGPFVWHVFVGEEV